MGDTAKIWANFHRIGPNEQEPPGWNDVPNSLETCAWCGESIYEGEDIVPGDDGYGWMHAEYCAPASWSDAEGDE